MQQQTDPALEEMLATVRASQQAKRDVRDAEERDRALRDLAALYAEDARDRATEGPRVTLLLERAEQARQEHFTAAAGLEQRTSGRTIKRSQIGDVLLRTMPSIWRTSRWEIEARIIAECGRDIPREARPIQADHVSGLQAARDQLDALVECPVEALAGRIAAILAEIPPRYDGQAVPVKSWVQQQAEGLRAYLANRFKEGNAA